ncbi:MAG TPA: hypothetical protein VFE65_23265 [Pseudonocardia sp.]|jgi:hypothetical protein|nr:hypothetical protein [Pseudonocardia sp.]
MWYQSADPDPLDTVSSVVPGYRYHCPDIASVDKHIAELRMQVGPDSNLTDIRKESFRADIDQLLERRLYLALTAGPQAA